MTLQRDDIHAALPKKGFEHKDDGDHDRFYLLVAGKRTKFHTKTSRGSSHREIGDPLIGQMAKQISLTKSDFVDLVQCTLSGEEYLTKLRQQGALPPVPQPADE